MNAKFRTLALFPALLASLFFTSGCSTNPVTGKQSFTAFMSREDEIRIGAEEHPKLIKEFGGAYVDVRLRAYVRRIGMKLARHADRSGLTYTFTILNSDKINALALPGGTSISLAGFWRWSTTRPKWSAFWPTKSAA